MKTEMTFACSELERLLESSPATKGMYVRVHGKNLIVGREESFGTDVEHVDRVRFTRINQVRFELAVKRHTGRWERTPIAGPLPSVVRTVQETLPFVVAPL